MVVKLWPRASAQLYIGLALLFESTPPALLPRRNPLLVAVNWLSPPLVPSAKYMYDASSDTIAVLLVPSLIPGKVTRLNPTQIAPPQAVFPNALDQLAVPVFRDSLNCPVPSMLSTAP